ncbi:MAG TPA: transmembrane 220 family protein [Flavihumibacter sp.]|jgi:heme A synthase
MKILNYIFAILFVISAALQWNDPDPYIWVPLYLLGAWLCWIAIKKKFPPVWYLVAAIIYAGYAIYLFIAPEGVISWVKEHEAESLVQSMKATKPWIEQSREFGGLLILLVSLALNWFITRRRS